MFYGLTKVFAVENGLLPKSGRYNKLFKYFNLEKGLIVGFLTLIVGIYLSVHGLLAWKATSFSDLDPAETFRIIVPAVFTIMLGLQIILFSFFFSILGLKQKQ